MLRENKDNIENLLWLAFIFLVLIYNFFYFIINNIYIFNKHNIFYLKLKFLFKLY